MLFLWEFYSFTWKENILENRLKAWRFLVGGTERGTCDKEVDNKTLESVAVQYTLKTVGKQMSFSNAHKE